MKKIIVLLLLLALTLSALSSCDLLPPGIFDTQGDVNNGGSTDGENNGGIGDGGNNDGENNGGIGDGENSGGNTNGGNTDGGNAGDGSCKTKTDHTDSDENGRCDTCSADVVITLDFYAVNDLHGKVFDTDKQVGVDELTTYLKGAAGRDEQYIFLSSGDMWQGSAESNITKGQIVTDWMSALGFVSMTLGNHEYDWGSQYIRENAEIADFPLLAINVYDISTNKRVDYCQPSVVVDRGELKIGIIGAIGDVYSSISSDKVSDVYFKTGSELTALVKAESERLRALGCDFIVYSIHDGYDKNSSSVGSISALELSAYYDTSLSREGYVDLVFEGHTHKSYVLYDNYGVYHLQNGGENAGISHIELDINFVTDSFKVNLGEIVSSSTYAGYASDPIVSELEEKYKDIIGGAFDVLGYNSAQRNSEFIEELVAKLYYQAGVERWGDEYDIVLGGGFLRCRSPYYLYKGEVTYSDLMAVMPFDNEIVLCSIKGSDLKSKFFETSNDDYHIYYESYGATVKGNIDPNKTYYIIVDSYTSQYAYNNLTVVEVFDKVTFARDLLAGYIKSGGLE
nr:bifunctional metallophosphatase/5'-nucleotidase [Clostridia bacterium]